MSLSIHFSINGEMISARAEAGKRLYDAHVGKSGKLWLVAVQENSADNIYVEGGPGCRGFGGDTMFFELANYPTAIQERVSDHKIALKGPWHSNPTALLADTGLDILDRHLTQGIVALERDWNGETYSDILHYDEEPTLGTFNRIVKIAKEITAKYGVPTYYAYRSTGGGGSGKCL